MLKIAQYKRIAVAVKEALVEWGHLKYDLWYLRRHGEE
jgi:hypothetical protein